MTQGSDKFPQISSWLSKKKEKKEILSNFLENLMDYPKKRHYNEVSIPGLKHLGGGFFCQFPTAILGEAAVTKGMVPLPVADREEERRSGVSQKIA